MDDGADLVSTILKHTGTYPGIIGGRDHHRRYKVKGNGKRRKLEFPVIAVNETRQNISLMAATEPVHAGRNNRATNVLLAVQPLWCAVTTGAERPCVKNGAGANVRTEVDPVKALEAKMDGYRVANVDAAAYGVFL